jgi:hypothetical protein
LSVHFSCRLSGCLSSKPRHLKIWVENLEKRETNSSPQNVVLQVPLLTMNNGGFGRKMGAKPLSKSTNGGMADE